MDLLKSIRQCALWEVVSPESSDEYRLRRIFRWYSRTFYTPLHIVETLPLPYVLQNFYEYTYESKQDDDKLDELEDERIELTENEEQRRERLKRAAAVEAADDDFVEKAEAEERKKKALAKAPVRKLSSESKLPEAVPAKPAFNVQAPSVSLGEVVKDGVMPPDLGLDFELGEDEDPFDSGDAPEDLPRNLPHVPRVT